MRPRGGVAVPQGPADHSVCELAVARERPASGPGTPVPAAGGPEGRESSSLLRNRRYLIYNAEHAFSSFGYSLYTITIPAFSYVFSGSILFTGLTLFVEYGIYALTFLAGPVADRVVDKRRVLTTSEAAVGVLALVLGVLIESGDVTELSFLALVGAIAVAWDFAWTADWTVLPLIVGEEELPRARGYASAVSSGHTVAGLSVGGALFVFLGAYSSIVLYSGCMLVGAFLLVFLPAMVPREGRVHSEGLLAGWRYVFSMKSLLYLSLAIGVFAFFTQVPVLGITRVFAQTSTLWYSVMFTLYNVGSTVSGALFGRFYPRRRLGLALTLTFVASGALLAPSVLEAGSLAVDAALWFGLGVVFNAWVTLYGVYLQATTAKEMLGRTASNLYTFRGVTSAVGTVSLPYLIQASGIVNTAVVSGGCLILVALAIYAGLPKMRAMGLGERKPPTRPSPGDDDGGPAKPREGP